MTTDRFEPFFIDSPAGRIFALLRAPTEADRCVLFVPPFGEEMNKCRRQFTETTADLVARGHAALLIDLYGTGDSEGEFSDASWSAWKKNVAAAVAWTEASDLSVESLVATRLGCALAAEALSDVGKRMRKSVFWQPVSSGAQFMTQFLRLRVAASMMDDDNQETVEGLKKRLESNETLQISGYSVTPELWGAIEQISLANSLGKHLGVLKIFEIGRARDGSLSRAGQLIASAAEECGMDVEGQRVAGEPFWTATEIVVNAELRKLTVEWLLGEVNS